MSVVVSGCCVGAVCVPGTGFTDTLGFSSSTPPPSEAPAASFTPDPESSTGPANVPAELPVVADGCPTSAEASLLRDEASGLSLEMRPVWQQMHPGDPGWVEIYGDHNSDVEQSLVDGSMQDFALALRSADKHTLALAVYVRPVPQGVGAADVADAYAQVLTTYTGDGGAGGVMMGRRAVELPSGPAELLEAFIPKASSGTYDGINLAYVTVHGDFAYYVVLRGAASNMGVYTTDFGCMGESLRFLTQKPGSSSTATAKP